MIVCVKCGHQNQEGQRYCENCKFMLPKISEYVSAPPPERINIHYDQLKEAGEKIQSKEITAEQFLETLNRIYGVISERLAEIENMEISDDVRPSLEEQLNLGVSGIHYFLQGIDEMRLYAEDSNAEHIAVGMESIYQGNENLNNALEMARENIRKLKDMGVDSQINTQS